MIRTIPFRMYPIKEKERKLHEIFTIYNRMKRIGYKLAFEGKELVEDRQEERKRLNTALMETCENNSYVNTLITNIFQKLDQQETWLEKRRKNLEQHISTIQNKINSIKNENKNDRRLRKLYSTLSSKQNKLLDLKLKPIVFGTKTLFWERIKQEITRKEFKIKRDSSFSCTGKKQHGVKNMNIKLLSDDAAKNYDLPLEANMKWLKIRTFSREKGRTRENEAKKWMYIPISVSPLQQRWYDEILNADKYTVTIVRRIINREVRYFAHFSYEIPEREMLYGYENGAIGLDFNHNFTSLANVDRYGNLLSYQNISFGNLHTYRASKSNDFISYKMDKIINYCKNKRKGIVIEDLSFDREFSYNKKKNRKLNSLKTSALELLKRKCLKEGVSIRKVHPHYTSLIGKYKYSRSHNLSTHALASFVIARRGLGLKEDLPAVYKWLLSRVGEYIEPRLNQSSPYHEWSQVHDFFKHCGSTTFKTAEIMKKALSMTHVLNSVTSEQHDNLSAGLSPSGKIDDWHKFLEFYRNYQFFINN